MDFAQKAQSRRATGKALMIASAIFSAGALVMGVVALAAPSQGSENDRMGQGIALIASASVAATTAFVTSAVGIPLFSVGTRDLERGPRLTAHAGINSLSLTW